MNPLLIIAALERKLIEVSHSALQRPNDTTLYGYGHSVGTYQGILQSINEVKRLMNDQVEEA